MIIKKYIILFLFLFSFTSIFCQIKLKIYAEKTKNGYTILAENDEFCPVSVNLDFSLNNMISTNGNNKIFVVPARTKGYFITKLDINKRGKYGYNYKTNYNYGDHFNEDTDVDFVYELPFEKNKSFKLHQGYNGSFSHQNEFSLDFTMPVDTYIYAARSGVVIKVVENNSITCPKKECAKYNNEILIFHADGTFSIYAHINKNGSLVKVGDEILTGQLLAKSGNIGFSTGPHLHFSVFNQKLKGRETLKTKFKINDGQEEIYLKEKENYTKKY